MGDVEVANLLVTGARKQGASNSSTRPMSWRFQGSLYIHLRALFTAKLESPLRL